MAFTEAGSWKVGPDGMYDLVFDPTVSDKIIVKWQDKCFMEVSADEGDEVSDFVFDETDLRWMECYQPWLTVIVQGKTEEKLFFKTEDEAKTLLKNRFTAMDLTESAKTRFYLEHIDGSYYYEKGRIVFGEPVNPYYF